MSEWQCLLTLDISDTYTVSFYTLTDTSIMIMTMIRGLTLLISDRNSACRGVNEGALLEYRRIPLMPLRRHLEWISCSLCLNISESGSGFCFNVRTTSTSACFVHLLSQRKMVKTSQGWEKYMFPSTSDLLSHAGKLLHTQNAE